MGAASASVPVWMERRSPWTAAMLAVSLLVHGAMLAYLARRQPTRVEALQKPVELVMVEVEPPKPPEPPPPPPEKPKARPPPIRVARPEIPPPPPPVNEPPPPPPPNDAPPPDAPPEKPVLVVGISMSSTTTSGSFAAPVGNTLYGKTEKQAVDPNEVKAYSAPKYMPIHQVDSEPKVDKDYKAPYPDEAKRAGVEGTVVLSVKVDAEGKVVAARVLSGPGYGLNEAALDAIKRFKFHPAIKNGEPVSTELKYLYTFLLD
jgi:protein TonB